MSIHRRSFLKQSAALLAGAGLSACGRATGSSTVPAKSAEALDDQLKEVLARPVLRQELFPEPVVLQTVDLLKNGRHYVVRVRSTDGAEGYAVANESRLRHLWPFFVNQVAPFFVGKDARELDALVEGAFQHDSNYKYQSMAVWLPIASAEFAILDMLGLIADRPVGALFGDIIRSSIDVYSANNFRGRPAEESVERIVAQQREDGARAVKFKLGGRMDLPEEPPGRSEAMIPMLRAALGDDVAIYADANGSYDVPEAIRIGRMLEDIGAGFFEEPCRFDYIWETKQVADGLDIPVAGGEQESAMRRFRWMAANDGVQVFQPDLLYFGGMIRSIRVARMAELVGAPCTPHMSGAGMGSLYVLHYASVVPNPGPFQEYKGPTDDIPFESTSSGSLAAVDGMVPVPTGPGLGVRLDPDWIARSRVIESGQP